MNDNYDYGIIKDVEFANADEYSEKNIRGKVLYYSTKQVADTLGVSDATIRYYSSFFEDILKIKKSNTQRQYTDDDISKLEFIFKLRSDGMTMNQVKEYCSEVDFDGNKPVVKENNPLSIQVLAQALLKQQEELINQQTIEFKKQVELLKVEVVNHFEDYLKEQRAVDMDGLELLKEDINKNVDDIVSKKLDSAVTEIKESLETKYISQEEIERYTNNNKSFLAKLFKL